MAGKVIAIAAMDEARVIGVQNTLPWRIPADMKRFSELTRNNAVLMGRKTWDSLPAKFRPLPDRRNIVLTRQSPENFPPEISIWGSLTEHLPDLARSAGLEPQQDLWIIGGAELYSATLPYWDEVQLTLVPGSHPGDAFFPVFEPYFSLDSREDREDCSFLRYVRIKDSDMRP